MHSSADKSVVEQRPHHPLGVDSCPPGLFPSERAAGLASKGLVAPILMVSLVGEDRSEADEPRSNHERLTVTQAAASLGITEGAVSSRIKGGTLPITKEGIVCSSC